MGSRIFPLFITLFLIGNQLWPALDLSSPTSEWTALPFPGVNAVSDFVDDTQVSSADLDLVGLNDQYSAYTRFDSVNTLGFRLRLAGDKAPPGFTGQVWIGVDVNEDANLDIFIGANSSEITFNIGDDFENTSPANTSINSQSPLYSVAATSANFLWAPVDSSNDPLGAHTDIDGFLDPGSNSGNDYFLTFSFDFDEFATIVTLLGGVNDFSSSSSVAYVVGTANQANTLNSDWAGIDGQVNSSSDWPIIGGITPVIPVPEPATTVFSLAVICFIFAAIGKRNSRKSLA